uniref:Uncharacterized protein n=1 Tax=Poecilia formosa TaxID=48698 RepID=A0A087YEB5_POEFO
NLSRSSRQMEDNPIYGNLSYMDASRYSVCSCVYSHILKLFLFFVSFQSKSQECYANLTLKAPRPQSGRISPQILVSDIVHLEEAEETGEAETEEPVTIDDAVSTMSDLYASVQTQRAKIVDTADGEEGYANHL